MIDPLTSVKKIAEKAANAARQAMSDKPPFPVELGGVAEKLPKPGVVISPPPLPGGSELKGQ
ncbi:MAG TPA: hypothetical protein VJX74_10950 [Blastocatellia bacterium]|nr:hypothetical protein [Blastocatellia bacterium]